MSLLSIAKNSRFSERLACDAIGTEYQAPALANPPDPSDVIERAAIIAEGDGIGHDLADTRALADFDLASFHDLADRHRADILATLDALGPLTGRGAKLATFTRAFVASDHFTQTVALGWSMDEMFAVHPTAPRERIEAQGLVPHLAFSVLKGHRLASITSDRASTVAPCGSSLTWWRGRPGLTDDDGVRPWWQVPSLTDSEGRIAA